MTRKTLYVLTHQTFNLDNLKHTIIIENTYLRVCVSVCVKCSVVDARVHAYVYGVCSVCYMCACSIVCMCVYCVACVV